MSWRAGVRRVARWVRWDPADVVTGSLLAMLSAAQSLVVALVVLPQLQSLPVFGADTERVTRHMSVRAPMLDRSQFHPLLPLLSQPIVRMVRLVGGPRYLAVHLVVAAAGAAAVLGVYVLGRRRSLRPLEAAGPATVIAVSGAAVFYFSIAESFGVAAACVVWALVLVDVRREADAVPRAAAALVMGAAAVITAVLGPAVAVVRRLRSPRRIAAAFGWGAIAAFGLALVQQAVAGTRVQFVVGGESEFIRAPSWSGVTASVRSAVIDAWVSPPPRVAEGAVTMTDTGWWDGGLVRRVGAGLVLVGWVVVARGMVARCRDPLVVPVAVAAVAHVALHSVYGDEPFLYAALLLPLVGSSMVVAASGPMRRAVVVGSWLLVPLLAVVNWSAVIRAARLVEQLDS